MQAAAQTFFPEQIVKAYSGSVSISPGQLFLIESSGEKNLLFALIIVFCLNSYSLSKALSYALVVDAVYDGYVIFKRASKVGVDKRTISVVLLIKVIGAVLGLNDGFGRLKQDQIIKALSAFWISLGLFGIVDPNGTLKSIGTRFSLGQFFCTA